MREVFDIERERTLLRGPIGFEHYLGWSLEEAAGNRALSRSGQMLVGMAAHCVIVGFDNEAKELLSKAKQWLEHAITTEEKPRYYFQYGTEAGRHENLALCNWLLSDSHDHENLDAAVNYDTLDNADNPQSQVGIAIGLPVYIDAGRFEEALGLYERYWPRKIPSNVSRIAGEASMSYVIAAARVRGEYSNEEVRSAGESFLRHKTSDFLERGGYTYLARWLKIIHWNDNPKRLSAFDTVRLCYDYLPNVAPPKFA